MMKLLYSILLCAIGLCAVAQDSLTTKGGQSVVFKQAYIYKDRVFVTGTNGILYEVPRANLATFSSAELPSLQALNKYRSQKYLSEQEALKQAGEFGIVSLLLKGISAGLATGSHFMFKAGETEGGYAVAGLAGGCGVASVTLDVLLFDRLIKASKAIRYRDAVPL